MLEDRLGNPGFAVFQGDTPYLISPYAGEIAEIDDRERQGATSDRSPITHRSLRCPPLDTEASFGAAGGTTALISEDAQER
jgi:hypothetical protein